MRLPDGSRVSTIVIFLLALSVRLLHLWQISHAPFFGILVGDARAYDLWARQIAGGDWIGHEVFYQAPLYPYLLGLIYSIAGPSVRLVLFLQALGGSFGCILLGLAGARFFSRQIGAIAGVLLAIYPAAVFFDGVVQKTALDALLVCFGLWLISRQASEPANGWRWVALGVTIGALCLTRENALMFLVVIPIWIARGATVDPARRWRAAAAFAAGAGVLLVPVAARNYALGGGFSLTTSQFGPNFFIGNNADADGTYRALRAGRGTAEFERADATAIAERAQGRTLTPGEVSGYWTGRALDFIARNPGAWGLLTLRKAGLLVNAVDIADTESQESYAEWSLPLRLAQPVGHFGILLPLALLGFWVTRTRMAAGWLLPALAATYAIGVIAFYVLGRYRYPLTPFVVLWAAAGLSALPGLFRAPFSTAYGRGGLVAAILAMAVIANWPLTSHAAMQAVSENNIGAALQREGRSAEALERFRRATTLAPGDALAHVNVGTSLQAMGRSSEAADAFAQAVALQPNLGDAHYFLARTLVDRGRGDEAVAEFRLALQSMPESLEVRTALGLALASRDHFEEAINVFQEVLRLDPAFPHASWNLGSALAASGNVRAAIPYLEDAVRRDPSHTGARGDLADAYNRHGIALASQGALIDATRAFEAALRVEPGMPDATQNLARARSLLADR